MKLNYTSLQHPVESGGGADGRRASHRRIPVLVLSLHGQLAPAAWAAGRAAPDRCGSATSRPRAARCRVRSRRTSAELRQAGLLCEHVTAGPGLRRRDSRRSP